jgi:hypothetical protein
MKKLISALLLLAALVVAPTFFESNDAKAQLTATLTPIAANDTLTNADTAWVYIVAGNTTAAQTFSSTASIADNISRAVTVRITKVSGTVAGTVTFQGSNDATNCETIDTVSTLTNVADQTFTYDMRTGGGGSMLYKYFRVVAISSGTNVQIPRVYYLRRSN